MALQIFLAVAIFQLLNQASWQFCNSLTNHQGKKRGSCNYQTTIYLDITRLTDYLSPLSVAAYLLLLDLRVRASNLRIGGLPRLGHLHRICAGGKLGDPASTLGLLRDVPLLQQGRKFGGVGEGLRGLCSGEDWR